MPKVLLKDVVARIKDKVDKDSTDLEYYIGGEHFDYAEVCITKRGMIQGSTIGPAFHMHFMPGDVLLMSRNPHLRKAGVVDFEGICSDVSYVCRAKDESVLLQRYLPFIFQTDHFWEFAERNKKGSTNFFLNWSDFEKYEFDLPSIEEQRKLTELLWAAQDTKMAYQELLRQSDELVKSQFIELFDSSENGAEFIRLENCCKSITGGNTPSMKHPEYYGGSIPFIKSGDVKTRTIREGALWLTDTALEQSNAKLLPARTVIVVIRSAALRHEFHAAVTEVPVVINQDLKALTPHDIFLPEYLMWALIAHENDLLGGVQTVLTSHIEMRDLLNLPIKVAPLEQQRCFCDMAAQLDKSKFELKQSIENVTALMKSLMQQDFSN